MNARVTFLGLPENQYRHDLLIRDVQYRTGKDPLVQTELPILQDVVRGQRGWQAQRHSCALMGAAYDVCWWHVLTRMSPLWMKNCASCTCLPGHWGVTSISR